MRIRDWSSDVCSSDLLAERACGAVFVVVDKRVELVVSQQAGLFAAVLFEQLLTRQAVFLGARVKHLLRGLTEPPFAVVDGKNRNAHCAARSEEHTSELQSLMRISYAVFCLQKKKKH